jgi:hypothetical protein
MRQHDELLFGEQARRKGRKAMKDPRWKKLHNHMWDTGNVEFFRHLHLLLHEKPATGVWARWAFCLYWDRATIPFEYWSYPAIERYLSAKIAIRNAAPSDSLLREWASRMELTQAYPLVVTDYSVEDGVIPEHGYHPEALVLHGIHVLLTEGAENRNIS